MRKFILNISIALLIISFTNLKTFAEENLSEIELNFFTGMFDFSDDKQASGLIGIQRVTQII